MKALPVLLLAVLLILGAAACAPVATVGAPATTPAATTAPAALTPMPSPAPSASAASVKDYGQIGSELMASETLGTVKLSMTESEILAALGQPDKQSEAETWGADGLKHADWTYTAKGLTVNMSESANPESEYVVYSITAAAPCDLATQKGVKIGDTKDAVLAAYADAVEDQSEEGTKDRIIAGTVFGGLLFDMKDGKVASIFIGASAE